MVVLSECFPQKLEDRSIATALTLSIAPKSFNRCNNDKHARFQNKAQSLKLLDNLNPKIQYTNEFEN